LPVKIYHDRYVFLEVKGEFNSIFFMDIVSNIFKEFFGIVALGLSRLKIAYSNNEYIVLRVDSRYLNKLITVIKYIESKGIADIRYRGFSTTLRRGKNKYFKA